MSFSKKFLVLFLSLSLFGISMFAQNNANVLCDKATATWCSYCPGAADIFDQLETQYGTARVPMIAWHPTSNDAFGTTFTNYWSGKLGADGFPTMWADHTLKTVGAGSAYKTQVSTQMAISRALFMSVTAGQSSGTITIRNDSSASITGQLMAVIVERHIKYNWQTKTVLDHVARLNCYSSNTGEAVTIPAGQTITKTVSYNLGSITYPSGAYPATGGAQFELVAFVMNSTTDIKVKQAAVGVVGTSTCDLKADFTHDASTSSLTVNLTDKSTDSCHTITGWSWTFGDSTTSTVKNPTKTYTTAGNYTVKLTVTNSASNTNSVTKILTVGTPCNLTANFTHNASTSSLIVNYTDTSTDSCHTITGWNWNFGDGTSSTVKNPVKTYTASGNYSVTLIATNSASNTATVTKAVQVGDVDPTYCASSGTDYSYFWISKVELGTLSNSSAGSSYTDYFPTVAAPVLKIGQTYNLTMTLPNATYTNWFKAYIDFNRDGDFEDAGEIVLLSPTALKQASYTASVTIPSGAYQGYTRMRLQTKNSTSTNLPAPEPCETFAYGEVEDYKVKIETNDCPDPSANFTYTPLGNYEIQFNDTSSAGAGATLVSWLYHFGAAPDYLGSSTLQNPKFTFPSAGFFPCCLDVTNNCGKSAGICLPVEVPEISTGNDDIIGVFPTVGGLWKMEYATTTFNWTRWSLQEPDMIRMADVNGNGIDDLGCFFKATQKFWIRYDDGTWVEVPASAKDMICFDLGDLNKDGQADILGSWTFGTWWKNTATGVWSKLSNMSPTYLAAGDFDGDGYCDMVGLYPTLSSLWIYQYNGNKWTQISKQIALNDLRTGDFDDDGKAEVLGSWNIGTWTFNPTTNVWVKHSNNQASVVCAGDINGLNKDDIFGDWTPSAAGLWIKYLEDGLWKQASKQVPSDITSGKTK